MTPISKMAGKARKKKVAATYYCTESGGGGTTPEWLPEGAVAYADFVNGHYWIEGSGQVAATAVLPNADTLVDTSGYAFTGNSRRFSTAFEAKFLTPTFTIVIEIEAPASGNFNGYIVDVRDVSDSFEWYVSANNGPGAQIGKVRFVTEAYDATTHSPSTGNAGQYSAGRISRVAASRTAVGVSMSADGAAATVIATGLDAVPATAWAVLGNWDVNVAGIQAFSLRSIAIYPLKANVDLPALSALS